MPEAEPLPQSDPNSLVGDVVLGRYRLTTAVAEGGMGVIYLARQEGDAGFKRPAVIKRLRPEIGGDASMVDLFMREARILSQLQHPGIVGVLDFAVEAGCHVMALEYVRGYHVGLWSRYLRHESLPFDPQLVIHIVAAVLDTLEYVHTRTDAEGKALNIVHRDVTPSNVMVDTEGHVKLLDFGIARSEQEATKDASAGSIKGKFSYLSPEVLDGGKATQLGDIYSCGVMLHALIWGRNAFLASTPAETLRRVLLEGLPPLAEHFEVPEGLDAVIAKATTRDPKERYQSAAEFAREARKLLEYDQKTLSEKLRATAQKISAPDAIPKVLELPTLEARDRSWREFVAPERPKNEAVLAPAPTKRNWLAPIAVVLALAAAGGAIAFALTRPPTSRPTIIVDPTPRTDQEAAPEDPVEPVDVPIEETAMMEEAAVMNTSMRVRTESAEQVLARAFSRSVPALRRCFEQHNDTDTDAIQVRLSVRADGSVQSARIRPTSLPAALSSCLENEASRTTFPRQARALEFTGPVTIRRR